MYTAEKAAPGNLIIRQFCLIDLFSGEPNHGERILNQVELLSGGGGDRYRTWVESYTYWKYTQMALDPWMKKYADSEYADTLMAISKAVKRGFAFTAYKVGENYWPAPFGDLWEVPLDNECAEIADSICFLGTTAHVKNMKRYYLNGLVQYDIKAWPMGLNGHCEKENKHYRIMMGKPHGFRFYKGYDKKYVDAKHEWKDLLHPMRILRSLFIW